MPPVTANDAAAFKALYDARAERLVSARERAEKWIAGLTALVTVLTTAMVVKGPENFAKADGAVRGLVLAFVILGAAGLAIGLLAAYTAAFGGIVRKSKVDVLVEAPPTTANDAAAILDAATQADAKSSRQWMRVALGATCLAMISLTLAVAFAWFATSEAGDGSTCVKIGDQTVVFDGDVSVSEGAVTFVDCPD